MTHDNARVDPEYAALMALQDEQERAARLAKGLPPEEIEPPVDEVARTARLAKAAEARKLSMGVIAARKTAVHEMFEKASRGMTTRPSFKIPGKRKK